MALLVLAGIPTLLHSTGRFDVADCANPGALLASSTGDADGGATIDEGRRGRRYDRYFGAGSWSQGTVAADSGGFGLRYVIVRSFDPKRVYHWPEAAVIGLRSERRALEVFQRGAETLPLHRVYFGNDRSRSGESTLAAYLLVYNWKAVANPYLAQLLAAAPQLVTGRRPMWLFMIFGEVEWEDRAEAEQAAREWLLASWRNYRSVCAP